VYELVPLPKCVNERHPLVRVRRLPCVDRDPDSPEPYLALAHGAAKVRRAVEDPYRRIRRQVQRVRNQGIDSPLHAGRRGAIAMDRAGKAVMFEGSNADEGWRWTVGPARHRVLDVNRSGRYVGDEE